MRAQCGDAFVPAGTSRLTDIQGGKSCNGLEGVWRVTRTPINCATGEQVRPSFPAIMTFIKDGIYTGFGVPAGSTPTEGSSEYGTWKREPGVQNYSFRFLGQLYR